MVERYVLPDQATTEREFMPVECWWRFTASFNVSFQQYVPAICMHGGNAEGVMMRWGLIPAVAKGQPSDNDAPSADIDLIERDPDFREPWLNNRRCILPASGFYVWQLTPEKFKRPFFIRLVARSVFGIAAVWDRSEGDDDHVIESCAVVTLPANSLVAGIDNVARRMPAILRRKHYSTWLTATPAQARGVLAPYPAEWMEARAVSPRINSLKHNDAALIQPVS
jgi:putative SOS response-associated peptidase YedK